MLSLFGVHTQTGSRVETITKVLCRLYLGLSLGFLQPLFLLLALLMCQQSLRCARLPLPPPQQQPPPSPPASPSRCRRRRRPAFHS